MKRLLLTSVLSVWAVSLALATTNYINSGVVNVVSPPEIAPQIDASNFVNYGTFWITNVYSNDVQPPLPYETWDTRNWTNANQMAGDSGFRFDYFDSVGLTNGWSANFQNAGNVNPTNANIFGASYVLISATNVFNYGTLAVGGPGLFTINGKSIDLTRGTLGAVGNESNNLAGVQDLYWGTDVGQLPNSFFDYFAFGGLSNVEAGLFPVTTIVGEQYVQEEQFLQLTNFNTYVTTNFFGPNIEAIDVLFLQQTNPAITTEVRFGFGDPGVEKFVQWQALQTNRVNGAVTTNQLYLDDDFSDWFLPAFLVQTAYPWPIYQFFAAATYHPFNYTITHAAPFGYATYPVMPPTILDPSIFDYRNFPVYMTNVGYAATITAAAFPPNPTISGATWTNTLGRIEVTALGAGSSLNLTRTLMNGQSYLLLSATNHFVGSTNAAIISPVSDVYLHSTNGMMAISNLTTPFVPCMAGEIQVWSGRWTNSILATSANNVVTNFVYYNVTVIDSDLAPHASSQIQNLSLSSTNLLIGDALNVFGSLLLDTVNLTITTNANNAPTPYGTLNLISSNLVWSASLPVLQNLTNFGLISSLNSIYFAGARTPPWYSGTFDEPYLSFVTHGLLLAQGDTIWADYFEASGTNSAGVGPISVQADSAIVTNGAFLATDADITLTCGSLLISNQVLQAGRSISLTVTNYLDDGSLSNTVSVTTSQNVWTVGGGINLWLLPPEASLLATTVTNTAFPNAEADNSWAGTDYGSTPSGFVNNAALGRLILDDQDSGSLLAFKCTGLTNALYVDEIEFKDAAMNYVSGSVPGTLDWPGFNLATNFTIYYGDAIVNGFSIAELLNGGYGVTDTNGGRFRWVSNYNTGFFSSTNVVYTDGSVHRLNRALVYSCDINSNGQPYPPTDGFNATCDGSILKPNPVPVLTPATLVLTVEFTNQPARSVVLSWDTLPLASNYLYSSSSLPGTNWQLVTNFLSGSAIGGRVTNTYPISANGALYYRVAVQSP